MTLDWSYIADPYLIGALEAGLVVTLLLTLCGTIGALIAGLLTAAARTTGPRFLQTAAMWYVNSIRNVPLLIALFFAYFGVTIVFPPSKYPILRSPYLGDLVTVVTISVVMGGFVAEVLRGGVEALTVGQMEAALASGLRPSSAYRHVLIPQLLPIVLPGLCNEMVNVLKGTTLAMTIGVTELMWQAQRIESETFRGVETMTAVTIIYFVLSCGIIAMFRGLEHLVRIPGTR